MSRTGLFWFGIIALIVVLVIAVPPTGSSPDVVTYSDFVEKVSEGEVSSVTIRGQQIVGKYQNKAQFRTTGPANSDGTVEILEANGVAHEFEEVGDDSLWITALFTLVPILLLIFAFIWFMRQVQGTNGRAMNFG